MIRIGCIGLGLCLLIFFAAGCGNEASLGDSDSTKTKKSYTLYEQIKELQDVKARIDVPVRRMSPSSISEELSITGELVPTQSVIVKPLMDGRIQFLGNLKVGDVVEKGATLAKIDDRDIKDDIEHQQKQIEITDEQLKLNEEELQQQRKNAEFDRVLVSKGYINQNALEKSLLELKKAENALEKSRISLEQEKSKLRKTIRQMEKVPITAPIEGVVVPASHLKNQSGTSDLLNDTIMEWNGKLVSTSTDLFGIVSRDAFLARCLVNGKDKARIQPGQNVEVIVFSHTPIKVAGQVVKIANLQDANTHAYKIWIQIAEIDPSFTSGLFVRCNVELARHDDVMVLDRRHVKERNNRYFVQMVVDEMIADVDVELGLKQDNLVEVVSSIKSGDLVITTENILPDDQLVNAIEIELE